MPLRLCIEKGPNRPRGQFHGGGGVQANKPAAGVREIA